ncbi:MAG: hypothetical protein JSS04_05475 [Proteobacteria bacterium]|nr:hypothetical protein [Pseudomonadota bacterium]
MVDCYVYCVGDLLLRINDFFMMIPAYPGCRVVLAIHDDLKGVQALGRVVTYLRVAGVFLFAALFPVSAYAVDMTSSSDDLRYALSSGIDFARTALERTLTSDELSSERKIRIVISADERIDSPWTLPDKNGPFIQFNVGTARLVYALTAAVYNLSEPESGKYIGHVFTRLKQEAASTSPFVNIDPFYKWAKWTPQQISNFQSSFDKQLFIDRATLGVITFMLAHEIAHNLNGDLNHIHPPPEEARNREIKADAWAAQHLISLNMGPNIGMFSLLYYAVMDCNALRHEDRLRHPADLRRIKNLADFTLASLDKISPPENMTREQMRDRLQTVSKNLSQYIGAGDGCSLFHEKR